MDADFEAYRDQVVPPSVTAGFRPVAPGRTPFSSSGFSC